ncbi:MAG: FadR family transcriptional regulator [Clostridia bacterium]|nr:FadR family transcriptional regulator [Clostridia bacterium]
MSAAERKPVADEVSAKIKEFLFSGEIKRGDKLPSESALAERLGVGRSSIREALRLLASSGYIELLPNRGAFAAVTNEDELPSPQSGALAWLTDNRRSVAELLDVRLCIEPFAAELCASHISDKALAELGETLNAFERAMAKGDAATLAQCDYDFHRIILVGSENKVLISMYKQLLQMLMQYSARSFTVTNTKRDTYAEHKAVYDAIAARAPVEARCAMLLHISIAKRRMSEI